MEINLTPEEEKHILERRALAEHNKGYNRGLQDAASVCFDWARQAGEVDSTSGFANIAKIILTMVIK